MRNKGYQRVIKENELASKSLKFLFSLPLLPVRGIERGFILIKAYAVNQGVHVESLFTYYDR